MQECYHCGVVFRVVFDDDFDGEDIRYCPACGEEQEIELDFTEE